MKLHVCSRYSGVHSDRFAALTKLITFNWFDLFYVRVSTMTAENGPSQIKIHTDERTHSAWSSRTVTYPTDVDVERERATAL